MTSMRKVAEEVDLRVVASLHGVGVDGVESGRAPHRRSEDKCEDAATRSGGVAACVRPAICDST